MAIEPSVLNYAERQGLLVLGVGDQLMEVKNTPAVQASCSVEPLTVDGHTRGRQLAEHHGFSVYDAMIVASALGAGCNKLYTEDMQNGMRVRDRLVLCNPFL